MRKPVFNMALALGAYAGLLALAHPAAAQQDTTRCATVTVSRATAEQIPDLIADAECFARALVSAANSQALRLAKARELAQQPGHDHEPPAPEPEPTPEPELDDGYPQLPAIPTNFDAAGLVIPSYGVGNIPKSMGSDPVGAFRFHCAATHLAYDDPIIYPGQPGASHLHMFFGNTLADAHSTFETLRTTGESSCRNALNRSAYWVPALMNGQGQVVMPQSISIYYKRYPQSDPHCAPGADTCIGLPRGLRYVFGRTMEGTLPGGGSTTVHFNCDGPGAVPGNYKTLPEAAKNCPTGARIGAAAAAPSCWNGRNLDSPDHRSHMAYAIGSAPCPATHPYRIPTFTVTVWYDTDDTLDRSGDTSPTAQTWYFSSDRMPGMEPLTSGMTFHSDWFGAWDDDALETWIANCIDKHLSCSGGELGDGTQMKSVWPTKTAVRLVDAPAVGEWVTLE